MFREVTLSQLAQQQPDAPCRDAQVVQGLGVVKNMFENMGFEDGNCRQTEAQSLIKRAIHLTRQQDFIYQSSDSQKVERGLREFDRLADTIVQLEADSLASLLKVEDSLMRSVSMIHRLDYEQQKVKSADTSEHT